MTQAPRERGAFSDLWLEPFVAARTDPRHGLAESDRERLNLKAKRPQGDSNPCFQDENLTSWT